MVYHSNPSSPASDSHQIDFGLAAQRDASKGSAGSGFSDTAFDMTGSAQFNLNGLDDDGAAGPLGGPNSHS